MALDLLYPWLQKTGIRGNQDTRQIIDGKTNNMEYYGNKAEHSIVFDTIIQLNIKKPISKYQLKETTMDIRFDYKRIHKTILACKLTL